MRFKKNRIAIALEVILLLSLLTLSFSMLYAIHNLQGTAKVINNAGIVRGGTQRLIKLECVGHPDPDLVLYLDDILSGLKHERANEGMVSLPDPDFQQNLNELTAYWEKIKQEIELVRDIGYASTNIIELSENYYRMADATVLSAELYAQGVASQIDLTGYLLMLNIVLLLALMLLQYWKVLEEARTSRLLAARANIDSHTGLPNKNRCEALINRKEAITEPLCVLVFDLNNLKAVNDRFGHTVGDEMIRVFAYLLRDAFRNDDFVGRCGGDEFLVIAQLSSEEQLVRPMEKLWASIMQYNAEQEQIALSFAYGAAFSCNCGYCTLRRLFDQADQRMYEQKRQMKAIVPDQSGQVR